MCGRFTKRYTWEQVVSFLRLEIFKGEGAEALFGPRFNVAPTQEVLAVRVAQSSAFELVPMVWGFVPSWSKDPRKSVINARAETLAASRMFAPSFERRRCLVPVSGFYEWQKLAGSPLKQPWYFFPADGGLFAFGAIWERWSDGARGFDSFAIVTTAANELVAPIHDRMPLIVPQDEHRRWLGGTPDEARALLVPAPGTLIAAHRVSTRVNKPSVDDASLIEAQ